MARQDFLSHLYPRSFYETTTAGSLIAAEAILPLLWQRRHFNSVIDIGCGTGAWLSVAKRLGAADISGVDGPHVPTDAMIVDPSFIVAADLEESLPIRRACDLCLCLEVAEHLSPARAPSFVADLAALGKVIAFSAAIPFQGGDGHLNEMWPEYWAELFRGHGLHAWDELRSEIWNVREIPWWYRQNLILFASASELVDLAPGWSPDFPQRLTMIHPESYLFNARRKPPNVFETSAACDLEMYYRCAHRRMVVPPGYGQEFPAPRRREAIDDI